MLTFLVFALYTIVGFLIFANLDYGQKPNFVESLFSPAVVIVYFVYVALMIIIFFAMMMIGAIISIFRR